MYQASLLSRNRHWFIFSVMITASLFSNFHQIGLSTASGEIAASLGIDASRLGLSIATTALSLPLSMGMPKMHPAILSGYFLLFAMPAIGGAAVLFAAAKELFGVKYAGTVAGFINIFPFMGGAAVDMGISSGASLFSSYTHAFILLTLAATASLILAIFIKCPAPRLRMTEATTCAQ